MNCNKGDRAVICRNLDETGQWAYGYVVTCDELVQFREFPDAVIWKTDPPLINPKGNECGVQDQCLRRLDDPGDDARDESLSWLPVPSKEVA